MFNKKKNQTDYKIDLPEDKPINQELEENNNIVEEIEEQKQEIEQPKTLKNFVSIISAEILENGLFRYVLISDREFKLGIQAE